MRRFDGLRYGLMGLPLAFVALPLYVVLPNYYAKNFAVPLASLGVLLLVVRMFDAVIDPLLGRWADCLFRRTPTHIFGQITVLAAGLVGGFFALFFPPAQVVQSAATLLTSSLLLWAGLCLIVCYVCFSALSIAHQSWGAMLGGDAAQRSRVVAWREGLGLMGVVLASVTPLVFGLTTTSALLAGFLALGIGAWTYAPRPACVALAQNQEGGGLWTPLLQPAFRKLLLVFMVNGIASAVPATLILFFVQDQLLAPAYMESWFLGAYFVAAALALPLWTRCIARFGLEKSWLSGMVLAIGVFVFASLLDAGDTTEFLIVCALSGVAMAVDLVAPAALLAGLLQTGEKDGPDAGTYFGWWNLATKFNLALAAGIALPLLNVLGYTPGMRSPEALQSLTWTYCLLPCGLKVIAVFLLLFYILRKPL